jgi:hypothetical protein
MGEGSYGDQVYPSFSIQVGSVQRNPSGGFQEKMGASRGLTHETHGFVRLFRGHVIQQDSVSSRGEGFLELGEIFDFHFDFLEV